MFLLADMAGSNVYTIHGTWLPWSDRRSADVAVFDSEEDARQVQFVLRWAKQCYTKIMEVPVNG